MIGRAKSSASPLCGPIVTSRATTARRASRTSGHRRGFARQCRGPQRIPAELLGDDHYEFDREQPLHSSTPRPGTLSPTDGAPNVPADGGVSNPLGPQAPTAAVIGQGEACRCDRRSFVMDRRRSPLSESGIRSRLLVDVGELPAPGSRRPRRNRGARNRQVRGGLAAAGSSRASILSWPRRTPRAAALHHRQGIRVA
jgi:hypothetical protein